MRICGGKGITGPWISGVLEAVRLDDQDYRETMVAMLGCMRHMSSRIQTHPDLIELRPVGFRRGSDLFEPLMRLWNDMRREFFDTGELASYPGKMPKDEWLEIKKDPTHRLYAYAGFAWAFKGVFFRSYNDGYPDPRSGIIAKIQACADVELVGADYRDLRPIRELVYMDPEYRERSTGLDHSKKVRAGKFNSDECWTIAQHWTLDEERNRRVLLPLTEKIKLIQEEGRELPTELEAMGSAPMSDTLWGYERRAWVEGHSNTVLVSEHVAPEGWLPLATWRANKSAGTKTASGGSHDPKPPTYEHLFAHVSQHAELVDRAMRRLRPGSRSYNSVMLAKELTR